MAGVMVAMMSMFVACCIPIFSLLTFVVFSALFSLKIGDTLVVTLPPITVKMIEVPQKNDQVAPPSAVNTLSGATPQPR